MCAQCSMLIADLDPIYESINFDSAQSVTALNHLESNRNRNHHHANDKDSKNVNDERDVQKFLEKCIPPPPNSSPPECDSDSDLDPIQISSETFKKLNELYEMSRYVRNSNYKSSDSDDVVYRFREVKDFSTRAKRGSSKTLWSFVPVKLRQKKIDVSIFYFILFCLTPGYRC